MCCVRAFQIQLRFSQHRQKQQPLRVHLLRRAHISRDAVHMWDLTDVSRVDVIHAMQVTY